MADPTRSASSRRTSDSAIEERGEYRVQLAAPRRVCTSRSSTRFPRTIESPEPRGAMHVLGSRGGETDHSLHLRCARARVRGALGPVVLRIVRARSGSCSGACATSRRTRCSSTPSLAGVRHLRLLAVQHRLRDAGIRSIRRRGEGSSFASLREYAVGDDPRHVDWKATARRQKLMTREYTVEQGQTMMIAVDCRPHDDAARGGRSALRVRALRRDAARVRRGAGRRSGRAAPLRQRAAGLRAARARRQGDARRFARRSSPRAPR